MNTNSTQQEILLITGTGFASRQLMEKDGSESNKNLSEKEELENACWQGMVKVMLPELFPQFYDQKKLFLWQVKEGSYFLQLDLAEFPVEKDKYYSIDPYSFLSTQELS